MDSQQLNVSVAELLQIIGRQQVEIMTLRTLLERLSMASAPHAAQPQAPQLEGTGPVSDGPSNVIGGTGV